MSQQNEPVSAVSRRNAIRRYGRRQATGFFLGTISLAIFFIVTISVRNLGFGNLADGPLWVWTALMFGSFLLPIILFQRFSVKDESLYCPHCGNFLGSVRAVLRLNKDSQCNNCLVEIAISPIDKRQSRYDAGYILGGLWTVTGLMYLVSRVL